MKRRKSLRKTLYSEPYRPPNKYTLKEAVSRLTKSPLQGVSVDANRTMPLGREPTITAMTGPSTGRPRTTFADVLSIENDNDRRIAGQRNAFVEEYTGRSLYGGTISGRFSSANPNPQYTYTPLPNEDEVFETQAQRQRTLDFWGSQRNRDLSPFERVLRFNALYGGSPETLQSIENDYTQHREFRNTIFGMDFAETEDRVGVTLSRGRRLTAEEYRETFLCTPLTQARTADESLPLQSVGRAMRSRRYGRVVIDYESNIPPLQITTRDETVEAERTRIIAELTRLTANVFGRGVVESAGQQLAQSFERSALSVEELGRTFSGIREAAGDDTERSTFNTIAVQDQHTQSLERTRMSYSELPPEDLTAVAIALMYYTFETDGNRRINPKTEMDINVTKRCFNVSLTYEISMEQVDNFHRTYGTYTGLGQGVGQMEIASMVNNISQDELNDHEMLKRLMATINNDPQLKDRMETLKPELVKTINQRLAERARLLTEALRSKVSRALSKQPVPRAAGKRKLTIRKPVGDKNDDLD